MIQIYDQVPLDSLKKLILSDDFYIREAATQTFSQMLCKDPEVVSLVLQSLDKYGWGKNISRLLDCRQMFISEEAVKFLCNRQIEEKDNRQKKFISWVISDAPLSILQNCLDAIEKSEIEAKSLAKIKNNLSYAEWNETKLWTELWDLSKRAEKNTSSVKFMANANAIVMALAQKNFSEKNEVIEALCSEKINGKWIQVWLTDLAGNMKLTETIPTIVGQLSIDNDHLLESSMYALGKIDDITVCELIANRYHDEEDHFKIFAAGVFEMFYSQKSTELLIKIFNKEDDDDLKISLIGSILGMNSRSGFAAVIETIKQYEEEFEYNPEIAAIQHYAVTHADISGISFAQRNRWASDRDAVQRKFEQDMGRMDNAYKQNSAKIIPFTNCEKKPGRNDPCPCNSGIKYKKCCMPSAAKK